MAMKRRKREDKSIGGKTPLIFFPSASYSVQHVHGASKFPGTIRRVNAIVGWPVQFRNWLTLKLRLMRSQRVLMTVVLGPFRRTIPNWAFIEAHDVDESINFNQRTPKFGSDARSLWG
jgi:hypothetical protein